MNTIYATGDEDLDAYWEWLDLCEEGDADRAWDPEWAAAHVADYEAYDFSDITDVREIRSVEFVDGKSCTAAHPKPLERVYAKDGSFKGGTVEYQWCRIRGIDDEDYVWRWLQVCDMCGSARCHDHKTVN